MILWYYSIFFVFLVVYCIVLYYIKVDLDYTILYLLLQQNMIHVIWYTTIYHMFLIV